MWMVERLTLAGMVLAFGMASPLAAQEAPEQPDVIGQLQNKGALTDEDATALRTWIGQRVQAVASGDPAAAGLAISGLRDGYKGTTAFKGAYLNTCIEVIATAYKPAKRDAAARLITVLNTFNEAQTYPLLIEALGDQRVPVRAAAAIGLRYLRPKLVAEGGNALSATIAALRDAGRREESHVALQLIYRAMDYTGVGSLPDPKANASAVLELLELRARQYETRQVKAEGADRDGLELARKLSGQLDDDQRRRLAIATAKMLHYGVVRYTTELHKVDDKTSGPLPIAARDRIELLILTAEDLLASLTAPPQAEDFKTVTEEMQDRVQDEKATYMKIAMNEWANVLRGRFQLDLQIDVTEPVADEP